MTAVEHFFSRTIGMIPLSLLLAVSPAYQQTPQSAALRLVYAQNNSPPVVVRVNLVGRFATVLIRNGFIEGTPASDAAFLIKHFSFGWQGIESLDFRCRLDRQVSSAQSRAQLLRGMPKPLSERSCGYEPPADSGPRADVKAIRQLQDLPLVPSVTVSGQYAIARWYGAGGGETLYRKSAGRWHVLAGGGGALSVTELRKYGVPQTAWCSLNVFGAKCAARRSSK